MKITCSQHSWHLAFRAVFEGPCIWSGVGFLCLAYQGFKWWSCLHAVHLHQTFRGLIQTGVNFVNMFCTCKVIFHSSPYFCASKSFSKWLHRAWHDFERAKHININALWLISRDSLYKISIRLWLGILIEIKNTNNSCS